MRDPVTAAVWAVSMLATAYGHVALKLAMTGQGTSAPALLRALWSPWAVSGVLAWGLSSFLWLRILATETLFSANSTAAIKDLILAVACMLFLRESITGTQWAGFALIVAGVWLVR
jgi:drug/metabolite transporter (DMT)-like permease